VLAATAMARLVTRPIEALTMTAAAISEGELDQQPSQLARSSWSLLAEAFNILTARLRSLITTCKIKCASAPAQLEARARTGDPGMRRCKGQGHRREPPIRAKSTFLADDEHEISHADEHRHRHGQPTALTLT